jgi:hypothetical protein
MGRDAHEEIALLGVPLARSNGAHGIDDASARDDPGGLEEVLEEQRPGGHSHMGRQLVDLAVNDRRAHRGARAAQADRRRAWQ